MVCLYCGSETRVTNSRPQKRSNQVWRRRQCLKCKAIFTTNEAIDLSSTLLVEVNGKVGPFLSDILYSDVLVAMKHRESAYLDAREATATITAKLILLPGKPLFSPAQISLITADVLKKLDKQAYLRFVADHPSLQK